MSVLITGGTGSLGVRLIEHFSSKGEKVVVVSRDEQKHFKLKQKYPNVSFLLGDVRDLDSLCTAFQDTGGSNTHSTPIDLVIHTAALKHVNLGEYNPFESIHTNILGAKNVIDVCMTFNVPTCVFVSTDKAVMPVNLYGMCKACAEKLFTHANKKGGTKFVGVRYGNVVNSNGSLIPFLQSRVKNKLPFLLTDPRMTRFFITLDQAVSVIEWARSGETPRGTITVPKLSSAYIEDIAQIFSEKYKLPIEITGIRPGEKLHELLISELELPRTEEYENYYRIFDATMMDDFDESKKVKTLFQYDSKLNLISREEVEQFLMGEGLLPE